VQTETKQLRVRVYHTYVPPVEASEDTPAAPGRWTLRIEGLDATAGEPTIVVSGNGALRPECRALTEYTAAMVSDILELLPQGFH
jgi:hypothetical protein